MSEKQSEEHGISIWFTATGEEDGLPLIFRGRQQLPAGTMESDYPVLMTVYWPYEPAKCCIWIPATSGELIHG